MINSFRWGREFYHLDKKSYDDNPCVNLFPKIYDLELDKSKYSLLNISIRDDSSYVVSPIGSDLIPSDVKCYAPFADLQETRCRRIFFDFYQENLIIKSRVTKQSLVMTLIDKITGLLTDESKTLDNFIKYILLQCASNQDELLQNNTINPIVISVMDSSYVPSIAVSNDSHLQKIPYVYQIIIINQLYYVIHENIFFNKDSNYNITVEYLLKYDRDNPNLVHIIYELMKNTIELVIKTDLIVEINFMDIACVFKDEKFNDIWFKFPRLFNLGIEFGVNKLYYTIGCFLYKIHTYNHLDIVIYCLHRLIHEQYLDDGFYNCFIRLKPLFGSTHDFGRTGGVSKRLYFERQEKLYCGKHALNHIFQRPEFTTLELDEICRRQYAYSKTIDPANRSSLETNCPKSGNYLMDVLIEALEKHKYSIINTFRDPIKYSVIYNLLDIINNSSLILYGVLINLGKAHWVGIHSYQIDDVYNHIYFDSTMHSQPTESMDDNQMLFQLVSLIPTLRASQMTIIYKLKI